MSLSIARLAEPANDAGNYPRLPAEYAPDVAAFLEAKRTRAAADKSASALKKVLVALMGDAPVAFVGRYVLRAKPVSGTEPRITLKDGRVISLAAVRCFKLTSGETIGPDKIASLVGARSGYVDLDVD